MASLINTTDIDAEYPVAGQDNDSQGFRDNFSTIKDNFIVAKDDIETLQDTTAKINANNDFSNNEITGAVLTGNTEKVYPGGELVNGLEINFENGPYQIFTVDGTAQVKFTGWPATLRLAKIRIVVSGNGTVEWTTDSPGIFKYSSNWPAPFTVNNALAPKVIDVWTDDGGLIVYAQYIDTFAVA
tara:strand:+ start:16666 stop:17220 length:555 start_codon:yes stop_codon:yes gene_type:complete